MDKIGKDLLPILAKRGLLKATEGAHICFLANKWADGLFSPISFSGGVLKVSVKCSSAASELHMKELKLVDYLNKELKRERVKKIRIINV